VVVPGSPQVTTLCDVSVRLADDVPTFPGNLGFAHEPVKRTSKGDSANGSCEMCCLPLDIAGAGGASARVVLRDLRSNQS